jgi:hypothetical protein
LEKRDHVPATVNPHLPLLLNKVPEVTAIFWVIKILSTTVGETGADYLAVHVGLGASATTVIMVGFLTAVLALQLRARSYIPWIYWLTVVLVSVVGTQITDLLTDKLEISLYLSTAIFAATLAATFAIWGTASSGRFQFTPSSPGGASCSIGGRSSSHLHWGLRPGIWRPKPSASASSSASSRLAR